MKITDAEGKISGGPFGGQYNIERYCSGATCTGDLTVGGWTTSGTGWWNGPGSGEQGGGPWTPPSP